MSSESRFLIFSQEPRNLTFFTYLWLWWNSFKVSFAVAFYEHIFLTGLVGYTIWKFYIKRDVKNDIALKPKQKVWDDSTQRTDDSQKSSLRNVNNNNNSLHHRAKTKNGSAGH